MQIGLGANAMARYVFKNIMQKKNAQLCECIANQAIFEVNYTKQLIYKQYIHTVNCNSEFFANIHHINLIMSWPQIDMDNILYYIFIFK